LDAKIAKAKIETKAAEKAANDEAKKSFKQPVKTR